MTLLSPIECSIDDIHSRIMTMRDELRDTVQAGSERLSDARGLTRLVQGSVLPQVRWIFVLVFVAADPALSPMPSVVVVREV